MRLRKVTIELLVKRTKQVPSEQASLTTLPPAYFRADYDCAIRTHSQDVDTHVHTKRSKLIQPAPISQLPTQIVFGVSGVYEFRSIINEVNGVDT